MLIDSTASMTFSEWTTTIKGILEGIALIIGGGWVLYRFGLFRERFPSMEMENGVKYLGENQEEYLLELYCIIENKGKVRKWLVPLDFFFAHSKIGEPFEKNAEFNNEVWFNHTVLENGRTYWVAPTWHIPFVDGGSKKQFNYLISVPKDSEFLYLYTRFLDFNDRKKAIEFILQGKDKRTINPQLNRDAKIKEVLSLKTDFYFTQKYYSITALKEQQTSTQ